MARYIIKIGKKYGEWSTVADAPITYGMTLKEFKKYYRSEYGKSVFIDLEKRLKRVEDIGTSSFMDDSLEELIQGNRAGPEESCLSLKEIANRFKYK